VSGGRTTRARALERALAAGTILLGTAIVGFSPSRWDKVVLTLPRGHGVHAHDVIGLVFVVLGIAALWRVPRSD